MENSKEYWYHEVFDFITADHDAEAWKTVLMRLASDNPEEVVKAVRASGMGSWVYRAESAVLGHNKVEDIRQVRNATGWGLQQAKEFVESIPTTQYYRGHPNGETKDHMGC